MPTIIQNRPHGGRTENLFVRINFLDKKIKTRSQLNMANRNTQQRSQNTASQSIKLQAEFGVNLRRISILVFVFSFFITAGIFITNRSKTEDGQFLLEDFTDRELLGENNNYSVYLINQKSEDSIEKTGALIVYDKKVETVIKMTGVFSIFGATIVIDDEKGKYVLLSSGTSMSRRIIPLSLSRKDLAGKEFCATSGYLFYKDYVVYGNCDTFQNRPWEAGQAASLVALNLFTGQEKIIVKSDSAHQYGLTKISGDTLYYLETFVNKEENWQDIDSQKTVIKTYNLLSL